MGVLGPIRPATYRAETRKGLWAGTVRVLAVGSPNARPGPEVEVVVRRESLDRSPWTLRADRYSEAVSLPESPKPNGALRTSWPLEKTHIYWVFGRRAPVLLPPSRDRHYYMRCTFILFAIPIVAAPDRVSPSAKSFCTLSGAQIRCLSVDKYNTAVLITRATSFD